MRICWILTVAPLALLLACNQEATEREMTTASTDEGLDPDQAAEILANEKKIREVEIKIGEALQANNEIVAASYYKDEALVATPNGFYQGKREIERGFRGQFNNKGYDVQFNNDENFLVTGSGRYAITDWSASWTFTWCEQDITQEVRNLTFWEKKDGDWKISKEFFASEPTEANCSKPSDERIFANPIGPGVPRPKKLPPLK